jgi:hypothetical protein
MWMFTRRSLRGRRLVLGLLAAVCVVAVGAASPFAAGPHYGEWSTPASLGPTLNSTVTDSGPAISKDGLSLYFYSPRSGGLGDNDIWVSQRASEDDAWGAPVNVAAVNSSSSDFVPSFSRDGHWMFIASTRPGGFGAADLWASWRPHVHDDFGWEAPVNLGPGINTPAAENGNGYFENDGGAPQLYFGSNRAGGLGDSDLYVSELQPDGSWGQATAVAGISSTAADNRPTLGHNGLEIVFYSGRAGGQGGTDLWVATRDTVDDGWSTPANLGASTNSSGGELHPYLAGDGNTLFFSRTGTVGGLDLYVTTRSKSRGHD